jgi:hypothetical protein
MIMDHREYLANLVNENNWKQGVELGVGSGMLFGTLLRETKLEQLIGVDLGLRKDRIKKLRAIEQKYPGRCHLKLTSTEHAAKSFPDSWADFIFIDAGHSYNAVKKDIEMWLPKLKIGGWFGGHDYHQEWPGLIKAVNEAFGGKIELPGYHIWRALL